MNPNKDRGDRFERAVVDFAHENGFPYAARTRAGYARDHGDVHLDSHAGPGPILQAKNHRRHDLGAWLDQLAAQVEAAGAPCGALVVKRRGIGDPGESYAVMRFADLVGLLRAAGWGSAPEEDVHSVDTLPGGAA